MQAPIKRRGNPLESIFIDGVETKRTKFIGQVAVNFYESLFKEDAILKYQLFQQVRYV